MISLFGCESADVMKTTRYIRAAELFLCYVKY